MNNSVTINNLKVYPFSSKKEFLESISHEKKILIAINAEKILKKDDQRLKNIINNNIGYTDGIGAVLAVNRKGYQTVKIAGVELWLEIVKEFNAVKSFYFIGSTGGVIEAAVKKLKIEFPSLCILGYRDGFIKTETEKNALISDILNQKPDVVFVAMGTPRQEYLMEELHKNYPALYVGLGGSFDIYSGKKKRAPKIFIRSGTEWFYRLLKEPARIKRQLILVKFFILLIFRKL